MNWLLDADVLSQPAKSRGDSKVITWLEAERENCYTSSIVVAQLAYWVRTRDGQRQKTLQRWLTSLLRALEGRIHGFSVATAHVWAEQQFLFDRAGLRMPLADSYIAATARRYDLTIVTGNDKDFRRPGVKVLNPFKS